MTTPMETRLRDINRALLIAAKKAADWIKDVAAYDALILKELSDAIALAENRQNAIMRYTITEGFNEGFTVEVPGELPEDRSHIPIGIYNACWWDRFWNTLVTVHRHNDSGYNQQVFYWPARKMLLH